VLRSCGKTFEIFRERRLDARPSRTGELWKANQRQAFEMRKMVQDFNDVGFYEDKITLFWAIIGGDGAYPEALRPIG
jgi:hypothetical protein